MKIKEIKLKIFILCVITITPVYLFADNYQNQLDSLNRLIKTAVADNKSNDEISELIWIRFSISRNISHSLNLRLAAEGLEIANKINDLKLIASLYMEIGRTYRYMGQYDLAVKYYYQAIEIYNTLNLKPTILYTYIDIGNIYYSRRLYEIAMDVYKSAIEMSKKFEKNDVDTENAVAVCYNNIGLCERELKNYDIAENNFLEAQSIRRKIGLTFLTPHSKNYLAEIQSLKGNYALAEKIYLESIEINNSEIKKRKGSFVKYSDDINYELRDFLFDSYIGLLNLYTLSNNKKLFYQTRKKADSVIGNENLVLTIQMNRIMLPFYKKNKNFDSVISIAKRNWLLADSIGSIIFKAESIKELMDIYNSQKKYNESFKLLDLYENLRDTIYNNKFDEITYNLQKNEAIKKSNQIIKDIEEKKEKEIRFQTIVRNITIVVLILSIFAGLFFYRRYKLKNELNLFLTSVINSLTYPFYVINTSNNEIEHVNEKGKSLGIIPNKIKFSEGSFTIYSIENEDTERINRVVNLKESIITDKIIKFNSIETLYIKIFNYPIVDKNNKVMKIIEYIVDVTKNKLNDLERERLFNELKKANLAIAEESAKINELNIELTNTTDDLKVLNSTKDKFFAIIAHDLKNPLGNYKNLAAILHDNYYELNDEERREITDLMKNSADKIYNLLENLLEWSRSQRGKLIINKTEFVLNFIINDTINLLYLSAINKNIQLINKVTEAVAIYTDPNILKTILRNLVSNAVKFTSVNGMVTIDYKFYNNQHIISVEDNGIGMTEDTLSKLFRIDINTTTLGTNEEKGTGLGLILCKEFVEKIGGSIWVESELGKGSKFSFSIPYLEGDFDENS